MSILFINGSPNHHGNTASLAAALLKGKEYETLNLTDYTIGAYVQQLPGDGLDTVIAAMEKADTIDIGSPLYWHNICGSVRNVLDRFYGRVQDGNIVIPGSKNPDHIKANFDLFDFALTSDEMARIAALNQDKRYYTSTPELLAKYAQMVPPVDEQK